MRNKALLSLLALVLCISAFFVPMTAYAATDTDTTPPILTMKLDGETLRIEVSDDISGVEAVYIDGNRVNSLVNGKASVALKDYAGNAKQVSVYAVDYSGNRSDSVKLNNPYYKAPAALPSSTVSAAPTPAATPTPALSPAPAASSASAPAVTTPVSSSNDGNESANTEDGANSSESAIPEGATPFTPDGTGTVMDNATEADGKEFYTITTADDNVFYLIIDKQRTDGNVYFLNAVTEDDLMALAEKSDGTDGQSAVPTPEPEPTPQPTPDLEPEAEPEPEKSNGMGTVIFIVLAIAAVGGVGYYVKIVRPKQQAAFEDDGFEDEDDYGEDSDLGAEYDQDLEYLPDDDGEYEETEETPEDGE